MRILFLQKRLLFPCDTGGKIRTLNVLRHLAQWHEVTYLSNLLEEECPHLEAMRRLGLRLESIPWHEPPRRSLAFAAGALGNLFSPYPLNVAKDFDPRLRARAVELLAGEPFDLLVCDFVQMARNALGLAIPSLLFQHNVEAEVLLRLAERRRGPFAQYLRHQAAKMRRFEGAAGHRFARVVAVSERDRRLFEQMYGWKHVGAIDTAVDLSYFRAAAPERAKPHHVVFVGSLDWPPNVEGVVRFVRHLWPRIKQRLPDARFTIVGRKPPRQVVDLALHAGVRVAGGVPDVRPYLAEATVGVVPLYSGGGTRLKIFEMMAMRCAVVSTGLGAEGLRLEHDQHLLVADADEAFAASVVALLVDQGRRCRLVEEAQRLVHRDCGSEAIARQFESHCQKAVEAEKKKTAVPESGAPRDAPGSLSHLDRKS